MHQIQYADRYGFGVLNSTFWKFKMAAVAILKNTQKVASWNIKQHICCAVQKWLNVAKFKLPQRLLIADDNFGYKLMNEVHKINL